MSAVVEEAKRTIKTGHALLDSELSLMTYEELDSLARYIRIERERHVKDDGDDDWADAPLTPEEEAQLEQGRKEFEAGEYLTLDEFMKGL